MKLSLEHTIAGNPNYYYDCSMQLGETPTTNTYYYDCSMQLGKPNYMIAVCN